MVLPIYLGWGYGPWVSGGAASFDSGAQRVKRLGFSSEEALVVPASDLMLSNGEWPYPYCCCHSWKMWKMPYLGRRRDKICKSMSYTYKHKNIYTHTHALLLLRWRFLPHQVWTLIRMTDFSKIIKNYLNK